MRKVGNNTIVINNEITGKYEYNEKNRLFFCFVVHSVWSERLRERESSSLYIAMYHYPVNDSITKYALDGVITPDRFEYNPPQNIFNINQQKVFYMRLDSPRMDFDNKRMSQEEYASFMEEYFPVSYQSYSNLGYIYPQHLYYLNDSLIYSIQKYGLPTDMCNLVLNGKEVWM